MIKSIKNLFVITLVLLFNSCQEEAEFSISEKEIIGGGGSIYSCNIYGPSESCSSETLNFTSSTNIPNPNYNWSVESGNMFISGSNNNSSVTVITNSNFSGGQIGLYVSSSSGPDYSFRTKNIQLGDDCSTSSCPDDFTITELIPTCYPSSYPYGRYKINEDLCNGGSISWNVRNATLQSDFGNEIYVSADSQYPFTIEATISCPGCNDITISRSFTPSTNCP